MFKSFIQVDFWNSFLYYVLKPVSLEWTGWWLRIIWSIIKLLFGGSVVFYSLQPYGLQHAELSCPSVSPGACLNSFPLSPRCCPTTSSFPASESFQESFLHIRWPKYWTFTFTISPSNEYSGLISFRNDWFDLLAVQGTLMSLFQLQENWYLFSYEFHFISFNLK